MAGVIVRTHLSLGTMSATQHAALDAGVVAHVSFKVRCEALSHGEEVFLVHQGDHGVSMVSEAAGYGQFSMEQSA